MLLWKGIWCNLPNLTIQYIKKKETSYQACKLPASQRKQCYKRSLQSNKVSKAWGWETSTTGASSGRLLERTWNSWLISKCLLQHLEPVHRALLPAYAGWCLLTLVGLAWDDLLFHSYAQEEGTENLFCLLSEKQFSLWWNWHRQLPPELGC